MFSAEARGEVRIFVRAGLLGDVRQDMFFDAAVPVPIALLTSLCACIFCLCGCVAGPCAVGAAWETLLLLHCCTRCAMRFGDVSNESFL